MPRKTTQKTARTPATPATPPPVPVRAGPLRPTDLAPYGRRVAAEYLAEPRNRARAANLALMRVLGLERYDPAGRLGPAYRVFCALEGVPEEFGPRHSAPLDHLPAAVVDFWAGLIRAVPSEVEALAVADHADFLDAFVAAACA